MDGQQQPASSGDQNGPPEGVQPLFLSGPTCEIFQIKTGETVTPEKPNYMIKKAAVMADILNRRAISDFQPFKDPISKYPAEELLLVFDYEWKYGQNFYLCLIPEAADKILNANKPAAATTETEDASENVAGGVSKKKARAKGWISLGSEKEVDMERMLATRDLITVNLTRPRKAFGADMKFSDKESGDGFMEYKSYNDPNFQLYRAEMNMAVQAVPELKSQFAQTVKNLPVNAAIQYAPRSLEPDTIEGLFNTSEYRKFIHNTFKEIDLTLRQNTLVDIFAEPYAKLNDEEMNIEQRNSIMLQEFQSFSDLKNRKDRAITCIEWHPVHPEIVAMSCVQRLTVEEKIEQGWNVTYRQSLIIVWNIGDPIRPQLYLDSPDDVVCFRFNPDNPNLVIGGCVNGQTIIWDLAEHSERLKSLSKSASENAKDSRVPEIPFCRFVASSAIELGHKDAITDIAWLPKNMEVIYTGDIQPSTEAMANQFVTSSLDGHIFFWDLRFKKEKDLKSMDLVWKPLFRLPLSAMDGSFDYGLTKMALDFKADAKEDKDAKATRHGERTKDHVALSSKFFCGTEEGELIQADWVGDKKDKEEKHSRVERVHRSHNGVISDVQRSPFFNDLILSVGGNTFYLWKEGLESSPLVQSACGTVSLTMCQWSPTRPAVFYIGRQDGTIEVWDLLEKSHVPIAEHGVSANAIASISVTTQHIGVKQRQRQFLAAGDDCATLYVLEISSALRKLQKNERTLVRSFVDREVKRIGLLADSASLKAVATKEEPSADASAEPKAPESKTQDANEEALEKQYRSMEETFLEKYGPKSGEPALA